MPKLDENDCWVYQTEIEQAIRRNMPETMNGRYLAMLRMLGAQARRAIPLEEDD